MVIAGDDHAAGKDVHPRRCTQGRPDAYRIEAAPRVAPVADADESLFAVEHFLPAYLECQREGLCISQLDVSLVEAPHVLLGTWITVVGAGLRPPAFHEVSDPRVRLPAD